MNDLIIILEKLITIEISNFVQKEYNTFEFSNNINKLVLIDIEAYRGIYRD